MNGLSRKFTALNSNADDIAFVDDVGVVVDLLQGGQENGSGSIVDHEVSHQDDELQKVHEVDPFEKILLEWSVDPTEILRILQAQLSLNSRHVKIIAERMKKGFIEKEKYTNWFSNLFQTNRSLKVDDARAMVDIALAMADFYLQRSLAAPQNAVCEWSDVMHMYVYALACNPSIENSNKIYVKQQQLIALYFAKNFEQIIVSRQGQLMMTLESAERLIHQLEQMGDLLILDWSQHASYLYYRVIDLIVDLRQKGYVANSPIAMLKWNTASVRLTTKIAGTNNNSTTALNLEEMRKVTFLSFPVTKEKLRNKRVELSSMDPNIDTDTTFSKWSNTVIELLRGIIEEIVHFIGAAVPLGLEWCALGCGSLARGEACPYSDVEMCFVYNAKELVVDDPRQHYLNTIANLLELYVISMGESEHISWPLCHNAGFQFDTNYNPSKNKEMIISWYSIANKLPTVSFVEQSLYINSKRVYGSESVFANYQVAIAHKLPHVQWNIALRDARDSFSPKQLIKPYLSFLSILLSQLSICHGLIETTAEERTSKLVKMGKLDPCWKRVFIYIITYLTELRYKIHSHYGREKEDFSVNDDGVSGTIVNGVYELSSYENRWLARFQERILPIILCITTTVVETGDGNLFSIISPDDSVKIAEYWILCSQDELSFIYLGTNYTPNPFMLRCNLFFEFAIATSPEGTRIGIVEHIISKHLEHDSGTGTYYLTSGSVANSSKEIFGRGNVLNVVNDIHVKEYPELPAVEFTASDLAHRLTGYTCSYSQLYKFKTLDANEESIKPVLVSKTVLGRTLQEVLRDNPNFLEQELDLESFSWQFIRALLLSPEDDKPDNFVVYQSGYNIKEMRTKLVCVDNDHSFAVPIERGVIYHRLLVKSIIYCSTRMMVPLCLTVVEQIKSWNLDELFRHWLQCACEVDKNNRTAFPETSWFLDNPLCASSKCCIPLLVENRLAIDLFTKMKALQLLVSEHTEITHLDILRILQPELESKYYGHLLRSKPDMKTEDRFTALTSKLYQMVEVKTTQGSQSSRRSQYNTSKMLQSSLGRIPTGDEIRKQRVCSALQMKEAFEKACPEGWIEQARTIQKDILTGYFNSYAKLENDMLREEVISGIWNTSGRSLLTGFDFAELGSNHQAYVIKLLKMRPNTFIRLSLKNCSALTNDDLLHILSKASKLMYLDIRGCRELTVAMKSEILKDNLECRHDIYDPADELVTLATLYRLMMGDDSVEEMSMVRLLRKELANNDEVIVALKLVSWYAFTHVLNTTDALMPHRFLDLSIRLQQKYAATADNDLKSVAVICSLVMFLGAMKDLSSESSIDDKLFVEIARMVLTLDKHRPSADLNSSDDIQLCNLVISLSIVVLAIWSQRFEPELKVEVFDSLRTVNESIGHLSDAITSVTICIEQGQHDDARNLMTNVMQILFKRNQYFDIHNRVLRLQIEARFRVLQEEIRKQYSKSKDNEKPKFIMKDLQVLKEAVGKWLNNPKTTAKEYGGHICMWDVSQIKSMDSLFHNAQMFNDAIGTWDVRNVEDMQRMFAGAIIFNQPLESWDVHRVKNMNSMFENARHFNQSLNNWNVSSVQFMICMFKNASSFNQSLDLWNVCKVIRMNSMFYDAIQFNQSLTTWDISNVSDMDNMFSGANRYEYFRELRSKWSLLEDAYQCRSFYKNRIGPLTNNTIREAVQMWFTNRKEAMMKYGHIFEWNTSKVTDMSGLFQGRRDFNDCINNWDVSKVTDMSNMFAGAITYNQSLHLWNVSQVINMYSMFESANAFNQDISYWQVHNVEDMGSMFKSATQFNQPLKDWNVRKVRNFCSMFSGAESFNQAIEKWDVSKGKEMSWMFQGASTFNQPIGSWNVHRVTEMSYMLAGAKMFNQSLDSWDVSKVTKMNGMLENAQQFNHSLASWNVEKVTTMSRMFYGALSFDQTVDTWNVANVKNMKEMFADAISFSYFHSLRDKPYWIQLNGRSFNNETLRVAVELWNTNRDQAITEYGHISTWITSQVTDMKELFKNKTEFNDDINNWDVQNVRNMSFMFYGATKFNRPLNRWNVSSVCDMRGMFRQATTFNQAIHSWKVNNVTDMSYMFAFAEQFNQPLDEWETNNVATMQWMFKDAHTFNQPLNRWNVDKVTNMGMMFSNAYVFNQDLSNWNVSNVENFSNMFNGANAFEPWFITMWKFRPGADTSYFLFGSTRFRPIL